MNTIQQSRGASSKKFLTALAIAVFFSTGGSLDAIADARVANASLGVSEQQQQTISIKGTVTDSNGEVVIGASVLEKGTTNNGTITDVEGNFSLKVKPNATLIVSYIGFQKQEVAVAGNTTLNIVLKDNAEVLQEVVVVGYGTVKKSDLTGSVSSVKANAISRQPVTNIAQSLQGLVPGVSVTSNSGAPGGSVTVRIRGVGTVNNADPLYVVDGMPVNSISYLSSSEIESIEVLKDASATAIYGSRGANGVVLVTTKHGKKGNDVINVNASWGVQQIDTDLGLLNGQQWYDIQTEINKTRVKPIDLTKVDPTVSTNWLKEVTRTAYMRNYDANFSGGSDNFQYNLSLGYLSQDGTVKNTDYNRINTRLNIERKMNDIISVGVNAAYSTSNRHKILEGSNTVGIINSAIKLEPVVPVRNADGSYGSSKYIDYPNPVAAIDYTNSKEKNQDLVGNVYATVNLLKGLYFKTLLGINSNSSDSYDFDPTYYVSNAQRVDINKVTRGYSKRNNILLENTLNFSRVFAEKHSVSAVLGYTAEKTRYENVTATKQGVPNNEPDMQYLDAAQLASSATAAGSAIESSLLSYLGRVNYNYDDRYLATATFRADGSSRFGSGNRYGYFPSLALAWKLSNEQFFKKWDQNWLNSLKIRAGWGQVGNQNIDDYMFQNLLSSSAQYAYLYGKPETLYQGVVAVNMGNANVKWETTESTNIGLDLGLLNGRFNLSAEYYYKTTKDMLLVEPIPYFLGFETGPMTNAGKVKNYGFEFQAEWRDNIGKDFNYNVGGNISTIKNEVLSLGTGKSISGGALKNGNATLTSVGNPIGSFWGYKTGGLINTPEELADVKTRQSNADYGDVIFLDTNGDKKLTDADKTVIGNPIPKFYFGFNLGMEYKGIDLNAVFEGSYGNDVFNAMRYFTYDLGDVTNKSVDVLGYWSASNPNATMPRLNGNDKNDNNRISDRYIEDGSYLRLKTLQLGYTMPESISKKIHVSRLRVYVSGQNLFTITNYSGADPEIGQISSTNYLSRGVDIGTYPQARIFTGGINVTF